MIKKILKYLGYTIAVSILILILTNPSLKRFKEFIGESSNSDMYEVVYCRESNYFLFSVYEFSFTCFSCRSEKKDKLYSKSGKYIGVLMNFYEKPIEYSSVPETITPTYDTKDPKSPYYQDR